MANGVFKSAVTSKGKYVTIEWSSIPNKANRTSEFTAKMVFYGSIQGNALSGSHFTVNGARHSIEGWWDSYASGSPLTFKTVTITVQHDSNGNAQVPVSGYILYNSSSWSDLSVSGTAVLDNIGSSETKPTVAPSVFIITGEYARAGYTAFNFSGVPGATRYNIYHKVLYLNKTESAWHFTKSVTGAPTTVGHGPCELAIKFAIAGANNAGEGPRKESDWIYHSGAKFYKDSTFRNYARVRRWDGSKWDYCYTRVYDGSEWINS